MLKKIVDGIKDFFRPPPSEASQMDPQTALAGLFIEAGYRDGSISEANRVMIDTALCQQLKVDIDEAAQLRERAEAVQYQSLTPIGFAMASSKALDLQGREEAVRTMIRLYEEDKRYEVMENRLVMSVANCFDIRSGRVKELRAEVRASLAG